MAYAGPPSLPYITFWRIEGESVRPNNIQAGGGVLVSFDARAPASVDECVEPYVSFGDGSPGVSLDFCCAALFGGAQDADCHYEVTHLYERPGEYTIEISLSHITGLTSIDTRAYTQLALSVATPPQPPTPVTHLNPLRITSISELIEFSAGFIFWLGTAILVIMIVVGGFTVLTSAGDPARVTRGRNILFYSLLGFAIMTLARGIIELIYLALGIR